MAQPLDRETRPRRAISGEELVRRYRAGLLKDCGQVANLLAPRASSLRETLCFPPPDLRIPANGEHPYRDTQPLNHRFSIRLSSSLARKLPRTAGSSLNYDHSPNYERDLPSGPDPLSRGERRIEAREGPGHARRAACAQIEYVRTRFHRHTQVPRVVSVSPNRHLLEPGDPHQLSEHRFLHAGDGRLGEPVPEYLLHRLTSSGPCIVRTGSCAGLASRHDVTQVPDALPGGPARTGGRRDASAPIRPPRAGTRQSPSAGDRGREKLGMWCSAAFAIRSCSCR